MTSAAADVADTGRSPRTVTLATVIGVAAAVWGLAAGLGKLSDNSFLTHLATGRLILDSGIPRRDPYSFTAHGQPWVVQSWLVSALYGWLDRAFGGAGIVVVQGLITATVAAIVWRLTRPASSLIGRIVATGLVLAVGSQDWVTRPLTVGLLLFAVVVLIAERDGRGALWLLPIGWVWVNAHGSFPFGVVYVVVRLAGRALDRRGLGGLPRMLALSAGGLLLGAVSPLGPRLLLFPIHLLGRREVLSHVVEWQSPSFSQPVHLAFLAEALLALLLLMRRRSWEDGLVAVVFTGAALLALRNIPLATVALVPVLARGLEGLGTLTGAQRSPAAVAGAAVLVLFGALMVHKAASGPAFELRTYPVRELTWMDQHGLLGHRVAAQDFVGNYRELRYGRNANVFMDDRYDMFPERLSTDYTVLTAGGPSWSRVLDRYGIEYVLWERKQALASIVSADPRWEVIHQTRKWVVAARRSANPG